MSNQKKSITILQLYPNEMNIYGDWGNTLTLAKRLKWHGYAPKIISHNPGDEFFKKADINYENTTPSAVNRAGYFIKGFAMCIFNPTILFHWITVIGTASTIYHQGVPHRALKIAIMFLTVLIVQFGMDTTKAFYANKLRDRISIKLVHRLNEVAGAALIIASLVLMDRLVTHYVFPAA